MNRVLISVALLAVVQAPPPRYQFDAGGRRARVDQSWELRRSGDAIAVLTSVARCGSSIFISDSQYNVYRVDAGQPSSALTRFAGENQGLGRPAALTVDCAKQRLYVLNAGPRNVMTLDLASGAVVGTRSYERELYESRTLVMAAPGVVHIGGLWNPDTKRGLIDRQPGTFFDQTWIGQRLSLESGAVTPGLAPYETRCTSAGVCLAADLAAIGDGVARGWIASQSISTKVVRFDANGKLVSTIDVRSPKFVRDGTEMPVRSRPEEWERWRSRNTVIRRVFAFNRHLVVVHSKTIIGPTWTFGEQSQYEVFMNIYGHDGTPLVSDARLPDLAIGRDDTHLYAVDYGPEGRGNSSERVRLARIPITTGAALVQ